MTKPLKLVDKLKLYEFFGLSLSYLLLIVSSIENKKIIFIFVLVLFSVASFVRNKINLAYSLILFFGVFMVVVVYPYSMKLNVSDRVFGLVYVVLIYALSRGVSYFVKNKSLCSKV